MDRSAVALSRHEPQLPRLPFSGLGPVAFWVETQDYRF